VVAPEVPAADVEEALATGQPVGAQA
jgi:hypothetical protein